MDINSTEEERYNKLKDKIISIISYKENFEFLNEIPDNKVIEKLKDFVTNDICIIGKRIMLDGNVNARINQTTLKKSIYETCENRGYLRDLFIVFSSIYEISNNSILIKCEEYRYPWDNKAESVVCDKTYIAAFQDTNFIYPVKIVVEERKEKDKTDIHLTVTTKRIRKKDILETGVHIESTMESQHAGDLSFKMSLSHFVSTFNDGQDILIKYFPDKMLNANQISIKKNLVDKEEKYNYQKYMDFCIKNNLVTLPQKCFGSLNKTPQFKTIIDELKQGPSSDDNC